MIYSYLETPIFKEGELSSSFREILNEYKKDSAIKSNNLADLIYHQSMFHAKYMEFLLNIQYILTKYEKKFKEIYILKERYFGKGVGLTHQEMKDLKWDLDPFKGFKKPTTNSEKTWFVENDSQIINLQEKIKILKNDEENCKRILSNIEFNLTKTQTNLINVKDKGF